MINYIFERTIPLILMLGFFGIMREIFGFEKVTFMLLVLIYFNLLFPNTNNTNK
jgi:hypothetical protein